MNKINTVIYVEPTAKARPKSTIVQGRVHTYTPAKTRHAQAMIEAMIRTQVRELGSFGEGIPLRLEATFYRERPKSLPKRVVMPVSRPDYDNYAKLLTDALEKFVYKNDSQICTALIKKRFGSPPRIELTIEVDVELDNIGVEIDFSYINLPRERVIEMARLPSGRIVAMTEEDSYWFESDGKSIKGSYLTPWAGC